MDVVMHATAHRILGVKPFTLLWREQDSLQLWHKVHQPTGNIIPL